jgi:hypothetical protein
MKRVSFVMIALVRRSMKDTILIFITLKRGVVAIVAIPMVRMYNI